MMKVTVLITALLCLSRAAVAFIPRPDSRLTLLCTRPKMSARDDFYHEPHFQVLERESVAKEPLSYNRMLECAQQGDSFGGRNGAHACRYAVACILKLVETKEKPLILFVL